MNNNLLSPPSMSIVGLYLVRETAHQSRQLVDLLEASANFWGQVLNFLHVVVLMNKRLVRRIRLPGIGPTPRHSVRILWILLLLPLREVVRGHDEGAV